jgi:chemotaxis protein MotB
MRNTLLAMTALAIVSVISAGCVSKGEYMKSVTIADTLEQELRTLKARHAALQGEHARLMADRTQLERDLSAKAGDMGKTIVELRQRITALENENARLVTENAASAAENARLSSDKNQLASDKNHLASENARLAREISETQKAREEKVREVSSTYEQLLEKMKGEIAKGQVTISELKGKLTVNMVDAILFDSGKAEVKREGLVVLGKVVEILKGVNDKAIRIEGHTDNVAINRSLAQRYPTNWELSAARAINVARYLEQQAIAPDSLSAAAFGEFKPVADNATVEGRAKNRRIEIVLVPKD